MLGHYPGAQELLSNKRGYEALGAYPQPDGTQKRAKTLQPPSKVIHIRNLPQDVAENDLLTLAAPFGRVTNILHLRAANQAFIQMEDQTSATSFVEYHSTTPAFIRNHTVYLQYSNREEITAPPASHEPANSILLITISNMVYPITIDVLQSVFTRYGNVMKIVIFSSKTGAFQCLIQFSDVPSAANAKSNLDGQNIYVGCCTLKVQFSNLHNLEVKFNNEKSRDFTNPNLPSTNPTAASNLGTMGTSLGAMSNSLGSVGTMTSLGSVGTMNSMGSMGMMGGMGGMGSMSGMTGMGGMTGMSGMTGMGMDPMSNFSNMYQQQAFGGMTTMGAATGGVIIVSGLDPRVTPDNLFTLFGVYGDVQIVKILFNKKDTALVQMAAPQQAEFVIAHLNGVPLYDGTLHINLSKHSSIHLNKNPNDPESAHLTKDFTNSPFHRYKKPGSKNFMHITPPNPTLHISNIPPSCDEASLRAMFGQFGQVVAFKYFATDNKMALVQMGSAKEAVEALIGMHNLKIDETSNNHLRVSFAKAVIRPGFEK